MPDGQSPAVNPGAAAPPASNPGAASPPGGGGAAAPPPPQSNKAAVEALIADARKSVEEVRNYYRTKSGDLGRKSRRIRFWAVLIAIVGGLCPLLPAVSGADTIVFGGSTDANGVIVEPTTLHIASFGFVFLALAAGLLLLDQVFGYSSAWMRFRLSEAKLTSLIEGLAVDTGADLAVVSTDTLAADKADGILTRLRKFLADSEVIVVGETEAWIAEFKSGLLALTNATQNSNRGTAGSAPPGGTPPANPG